MAMTGYDTDWLLYMISDLKACSLSLVVKKIKTKRNQRQQNKQIIKLETDLFLIVH